MSNAFPDTWMPLYIGKYLVSTMHLSAEEHGIHIILLMYCWQHGSVKNDKKMIKRITQSSLRTRIKVLEEFFVLKDGYWISEYINELKESFTYDARRYAASLHIKNSNVREAVFSKDGYKCVDCGSIENLSVDHIIPVKEGGENDLSNYQTLCRPCNSRKGARL